jgi:hypothetical protein
MLSCSFGLLVFVGTRSSFGQSSSVDSFGALQQWMTDTKIDVGPTECAVSAVINFGEVLDHMSEIRESWLSRDESVDFYRKNALQVIYGTLSHKAGGVLLQEVYDYRKESHPDKCHFLFSLDKADQFGQSRLIPILSWDMTQGIASKIVWDKFDDRNIPKIALNYAFSHEADLLLKETNGKPPSNTDSGEEDCHKTLRIHGFLSRAQFQCGFADYSAVMMSSAKRCFAEEGEASSRDDVEAGMKLFDAETRTRGHARECQAVLHDFSGLVRR